MSYTIFRSLGHGEIPKDERSLAITSTHLDPHKADFDLLVAYYDAALDALSKGFAVVAFHLGRHMIELGLKLIIAWVREEPVPMEGGKGHDLEHLDSIARVADLGATDVLVDLIRGFHIHDPTGEGGRYGETRRGSRSLNQLCCVDPFSFDNALVEAWEWFKFKLQAAGYTYSEVKSGAHEDFWPEPPEMPEPIVCTMTWAELEAMPTTEGTH